MSVVRYDVRDRVAILTLDNPPVNAWNADISSALVEAVARAEGDAAVDAIVLIGAGHTFMGGADINIFNTFKTRDDALGRVEQMHATLERVENSKKLVVAAIHGVALGGGLELAMACHFRVSTTDAVVGQPEVLLGIIPGAGGTQRLPRLAGAELALRMCTDGRPIDAAAAHAAGIVDATVTGDLLSGAVAFANGQARANNFRKTRDISFSPDASRAGVDAASALRAGLKTPKGVNAPRAAIAAIEAALTMPFGDGARREREIFAECVISTESKAMRHLFFAEREASKIPDVPKGTPAADVERAAVIGAGTMGGGIAVAYANAGIPVLLKEVDQASLDRGLSTIRKNYEASVAKGKLTAAARDRALSLITPTTTYDGFEQVNIVVEAAFENIDIKKAIFAELGRVTHPACVLASNTSTLDIDALAVASGRTGQVVGHHFFSPANVMKLLEVVRGRDTSVATLATSLKLGKRLGKVPVVVGNCFGFVANRMLAFYMREAMLLVEEGATVSQVDRALTDFGMPVGPFAMQDIAGIDVFARIRQHTASTGQAPAEGPQSALLDRLFEMGRFGQKTGAGWYAYDRPGGRNRTPDPLVDRMAIEESAKRGLVRRVIADDEMVSRIMTALANEGARVLEEGYALRPGDIDVIYAYGFGFPRHRGGPMFYADTVGLAAVLSLVKEYRARFGSYWQPAPLLERLVIEGKAFLSA